jgi:heptosyltransferase-2
MKSSVADDPAAIAALLPNWIGDAAMATPALRALNNRYPDARLTVVGRPSVCNLVAGLPWIDDALPTPSRPGLRAMAAVRRRFYPRPDVAVVFPHGFRAALAARTMGARVRLGYARNGRSLLLNRRVPPHLENGRIAPIYMAEEYLRLVEALGCEDDGKGLELAADPAIADRFREKLQARGPIVGLAPGAAFGPSKQWPPERYAAAADRLAKEAGATCVMITGPGEDDARNDVLHAAQTHIHVLDEGRPTIDTMKAAISIMDLLICNDSGPRHVAVAFNVPTICIMGPTSPRYSCGPYESGEVLRVDVDCGPCQKPVCATDHRCMTRISPDGVVQAAFQHLAAPGAPASPVEASIEIEGHSR